MDVLSALRAFNAEEREVFERLLDIGEAPRPAMEILAMWLWQEFTGHDHLIQNINSHPDESFSSIAIEAKASLQNLKRQYHSLVGSYPLSVSQYQGLLVLRRWTEGIDDFLKGIVIFVCADIIDRRFPEGRLEASCSSIAGNLSRNDRAYNMGCENFGAPVGNYVNYPRTRNIPNAQPWIFNGEGQTYPEDERCMFVTFSRGHPLTREEVCNFFTRKYGDWVERVYVDTTQGSRGGGALYGRVVFRAKGMVETILGGASKVMFQVNRKTMYCRLFIPRRERNGDLQGDSLPFATHALIVSTYALEKLRLKKNYH